MSFVISDTVTTIQILSADGDIGAIAADGALVVAAGYAISVTGAGATLVNDGLIGSSYTAINAMADFSLVNRGLMTSHNTGIVVSHGAGPFVVSSIVNLGDIVSTTRSAINCTMTELSLRNSGLISGVGVAIALEGTGDQPTSQILNSGIIEVQAAAGRGLAIRSTSVVHLVNTGEIIGTVKLGWGDDIVDNRNGRIIGQVQMDDGDNLFDGGSLAETVKSGKGLDTLRGGDGNDRLTSGSSHDQLFGGAGNDLLDGGADNDDLQGGAGADTIIGGDGTDQMAGGAGRDRFVFLSAADSDSGQAPDQIADFQRGVDKIDLTGFVAPSCRFVGTDAFTGGGTASFGYDLRQGLVELRVDLDGDSATDFWIDLMGLRALAASDILI